MGTDPSEGSREAEHRPGPAGVTGPGSGSPPPRDALPSRSPNRVGVTWRS